MSMCAKETAGDSRGLEAGGDICGVLTEVCGRKVQMNEKW